MKSNLNCYSYPISLFCYMIWFLPPCCLSYFCIMNHDYQLFLDFVHEADHYYYYQSIAKIVSRRNHMQTMSSFQSVGISGLKTYPINTNLITYILVATSKKKTYLFNHPSSEFLLHVKMFYCYHYLSFVMQHSKKVFDCNRMSLGFDL